MKKTHTLYQNFRDHTEFFHFIVKGDKVKFIHTAGEGEVIYESKYKDKQEMREYWKKLKAGGFVSYEEEEEETTTCDDCGKKVTEKQSYIWCDTLVICKECRPKKTK